MKKILFALKDMNVGGVEKSLLSLLNEIDSSKYDVTVLLLKKYGGFLNQIPKWVKVIYFDEYLEIESLVNNPPLIEIKKILKQGKLFKSIRLLYGYCLYKLTGNMVAYYKEVFRNIPDLTQKYDVAISYTSIISYLTYYIKYKVNADKKIGWIHFDVSKLFENNNTLYQLHKKFNKIFIVSQESYDNFVAMFPKLKEKCEVKYNVISKNQIYKLAEEKIYDMDYDGIKILTLGRLSKEKGQDLICPIAFQLKKEGIEFRWYLIGDGNIREVIEKQKKEYKLEDCIILLGSKSNPYPYLKKTDLYVQTSRYEGYCISLAEARCFNLPIVTTDFAGAREQIKNHVTGSIVNKESLFEEVKKLCIQPKIREFYILNLKKIGDI